MSESGTIYTLLPQAATAQDVHSGPTATDIEYREDTPPNVRPTTGKRVTFADVPPPAVRGEVPALDDAVETERMATLAKKFLEYVKNAEGGSGSGEDEHE